MSSWQNLLTEVRQCTLCEPELPMGARPVVQLHPNAKILVAGQAPGRRVHASGKPFDDPSGDRLRQWMGIDTATFYNAEKLAIIPMGLCYPGTGKSGDLPPRPECAPAWRQKLLQQLPNLELTLAIGQYAQSWHIDEPKQTLTERVKNWESYWPELLPLPHPSPRNNLWLKRNPWFEDSIIPTLQERVAVLLNA
ncbi:uracil-DNA glycosylase [Idiomarina sp. WRN-38]|uniref:uracil-DNA glycosylase family protein n=1 Tax=Idiomarina sp. OXR-189 TaxID=3100175 RepID=UPI00073377DD|nr:uracil-DNA glycosylase family protein [Idiomarina sp. OXR-189]KTG24647.1 uracil-DNA glycosylase [Idiomarina sp. H105]MCH2456205.1 uracil-DNA glycosylase family protein [Idiomarina sp.]OAE93153.1 uracil-DNA glycosylase [Idiomarina sp. WRN-38]WPZ01256.1 uracil-DNA glycosylase family protein [Idiomarina sp. OXR-189]